VLEHHGVDGHVEGIGGIQGPSVRGCVEEGLDTEHDRRGEGGKVETDVSPDSARHSLSSFGGKRSGEEAIGVISRERHHECDVQAIRPDRRDSPVAEEQGLDD
jgi:hypothetical protein